MRKSGPRTDHDSRALVLFQRCIGPALLLLALVSSRACAHASSANSVGPTNSDKAAQETHVVEMSVDLYQDHTAEILLEFESSLEPKFNFPQILSATLGCQLRGMELRRNREGNATILTTDCDIPLRPSRFAQTGTLALSPIVAILTFEPKSDFILNVSIPKPDYVRCDPAPTEFYLSADTANCSYILKRTDRIPEAIHFQSGYTFGRIARTAGIPINKAPSRAPETAL